MQRGVSKYIQKGLSIRSINDSIDRSISPEPNTGCWLWMGAISDGRYPVIHRNKKCLKVHRLNYERYKGKIPYGLVVRHTCDQVLCVNPDHLLVGTQRDNVHDMLSRKRNRPAKGIRHFNAFLTDDKVLAARILASFGWSFARIASIFGVNQKTIGRVIKMKGWTHVK